MKKYKPTRTPHLLQQETEDGNARAAQVTKAAEATIAHTRELLKTSHELMQRTKARASQMEATAERHHQLERKS